MSDNPKTEVLFYHLEQMPLERMLPSLLEKSLQRGWRVVVQGGNEERLGALNILLWTYREDSFLPHGVAVDGHSDRQPVFLTTTHDNPNGASVRFFVDFAEIDDLEPYERAVYIFDGADPSAVVQARTAWKQVKDTGFKATYWQQTPEGRWQQKG